MLPVYIDCVIVWVFKGGELKMKYLKDKYGEVIKCGNCNKNITNLLEMRGKDEK